MKKIALIAILSLATAATAPGAAPAGAKEIVRSFRQQIPMGGASRIHLDFPVGELRVEGWDNRQVDLDVAIACEGGTSRCRKVAQDLRIVYNTAGGQLEIHVRDWPSLGAVRGLNVIATVHVPRTLTLRADLGVGEMTIQGIAGDLTAKVGVGEIQATLPKEAIGSARLDAGIGESSLVAFGRRYSSSGLISRKLTWDRGTGHSRVKVDCGVGEIHVTLT
jgi:hypothetical protein